MESTTQDKLIQFTTLSALHLLKHRNVEALLSEYVQALQSSQKIELSGTVDLEISNSLYQKTSSFIQQHGSNASDQDIVQFIESLDTTELAQFEAVADLADKLTIKHAELSARTTDRYAPLENAIREIMFKDGYDAIEDPRVIDDIAEIYAFANTGEGIREGLEMSESLRVALANEIAQELPKCDYMMKDMFIPHDGMRQGIQNFLDKNPDGHLREEFDRIADRARAQDLAKIHQIEELGIKSEYLNQTNQETGIAPSDLLQSVSNEIQR